MDPGYAADMEWAHITWRFIHKNSFDVDMLEYESADAQAAFHAVLRRLPRILPCDQCRVHMAAFLAANPLPSPQCYSSCEFPNARYCVDLHNAVNTMQGKPVVPFDQVHAWYVGSAAPPACPISAGASAANGPSDGNGAPAQSILVAIAVGVALLVLVMAVLQVVWLATHGR